MRDAATESGLEPEVADFLALASRGQTATYQATYPAPETGELVVANDPPDRRVDVVVDGKLTEVRLVLDGEAFRCAPTDDESPDMTCERTDAFVEPPGLFDDGRLDDLTTSLQQSSRDFDFRIEKAPIAGVEATCLITEIREGRSRPDLGRSATLCVSPEGVLLKVDQGEESLEAKSYTTAIPDGTFVRPDREA